MFLAVLLIAAPAQAYIDPGAGSLVLQLIIGGVASAFVAIKLFWRRIRGTASHAESESSDSDRNA